MSRNIIDELHSSDIEGDELEGEGGFTRSIIDELHFSDIQRGQTEGESGVLEVSLRTSFFHYPRRSNGR